MKKNFCVILPSSHRCGNYFIKLKKDYKRKHVILCSLKDNQSREFVGFRLIKKTNKKTLHSTLVMYTNLPK